MHGDVLVWFGEDSAHTDLIWFCILLFLVLIPFFISRPAETNWALFDLLEAEAELVVGHNAEYLLMGFAPFLLGEYANMILMRCGALYLTFVEFPLSARASVFLRALCSKLLWATI
ncbi:hypothetical protein L7F22_066861 [Adiantum nelumboides]|nr:hypothetical protein [Adiantum nelumboides]MCO5576251.1 hypothetical protein [Adiantum nelumboides]MCO5605955.1 hypothetical protein [Adiantum nelumboides]MCO5612593.1 hypothetical protein [Adiantum nelumboides]